MKIKFSIILITAILYWCLFYYVPFGTYILLPLNLFVTFLHEFGHSFFAIVTGGKVHELYIQFNGAGHATI